MSTAASTAAACPSCGVVSTSAKEHVTTRPKDLPYGQDPVELVWHKRRWRCREPLCSRSSFTESIAEVPPRAHITRRLCRAVAAAVEDGRGVDEVARSHRVSWPTVQRAVDAHAALALREPNPVALLGIDETRFGSPRWVRQRGGAWARTDPWETGFVDLSGAHGLLGQVDGRTSSAVVAWLTARGQDWKDAVQVVAIDPAAGYRTAVGQAMPQATLVVDHFHVVALANKALTRVRQRVTRDTHGRRGHATDPAWALGRLLLPAPRTALRQGIRPNVERLPGHRPERADPCRLDRQGRTARAAWLRGHPRHPGTRSATGSPRSTPGARTRTSPS